MKIAWIFLCMMVLICSALSVADAATVDFEIGTESYIDYNPAELSISYGLYSTLPDESFSLNVNESYTFDYAEILGITVNTATTTTFDIIAYLDFELPDDIGLVDNSGNVTVKINGTGDCSGNCSSTDTFDIVFDSPTTVYFGSGNSGELDVEISDLYGLSWGGPSIGTDTLEATVTLVSAPVPEPGTLLLLGSGLVGVAFYARRRKV